VDRVNHLFAGKGNGMLETLTLARSFAIAAHGDQMYGDQPYAFHLDAVVTLLAPFGDQAQIAGYLHDVVEDTDVSVDKLREEFGDRIADCVALVTDEKGVNRKERKARTNAKLSAVSSVNEIALIVKAADRLANLRMSARSGSDSKLDMYRREHLAFRQAVYRSGLCDELWQEMDRVLGEPGA
jgi:(p)ppGpp synthase/HD superfamily hydrolase